MRKEQEEILIREVHEVKTDVKHILNRIDQFATRREMTLLRVFVTAGLGVMFTLLLRMKGVL